MKIMITGHRRFKLEQYDIHWIKDALHNTLIDKWNKYGDIIGYSGMASRNNR